MPSWLAWMGPWEWAAAALALVLLVQIVVAIWRLRVIEWPDLSELDTEPGEEQQDVPAASPGWERR